MLLCLCVNSQTIIYIITIDVTVDMQQAFYTVGEEDGSVQVCAELRNRAERNLTVTIGTVDGTAQGMCYIVCSEFSAV